MPALASRRGPRFGTVCRVDNRVGSSGIHPPNGERLERVTDAVPNVPGTMRVAGSGGFRHQDAHEAGGNRLN